MRCEAARKYLYLASMPDSDNVELPIQVEVAQARAHVVCCIACQEFFGSEQRLKAFLKARVPQEKVSAALREQILARIAQERNRSAKPGWFGTISRKSLTLALSGLLVLTIMAGGLWLSKKHSSSVP